MANRTPDFLRAGIISGGGNIGEICGEQQNGRNMQEHRVDVQNDVLVEIKPELQLCLVPRASSIAVLTILESETGNAQFSNMKSCSLYQWRKMPICSNLVPSWLLKTASSF